MTKFPIEIVTRHGIKGLLLLLSDQVFRPKAQCLELAKKIVKTRKGLEIGGPSPAFGERGILPIYPWIDSLDNCNFSGKTTWEGEIVDGKTFQYRADRTPGTQFISEASNLHNIESATYDYLLSSHVIEHLANPVQGLQEWLRTLKTDGHMVILIPHYTKTFDHRKPVTSLSHLLDDFADCTGENDLTHLEEILEFHDLTRDPGAGTFEDFAKRSRLNFQNRCLHQHVFDNQLAIELMSYMNLQILSFENIRPNHILLIAKKVGEADNRAFSENNGLGAFWDERL